MPVFNAGEYIGEAVQSVFDQHLTDWELIIVNDGSTDNTRALLDQIDDLRICVIHQENRGVSAARNTALDVARGEYITFLDADDALTPRSLEVRANYLQAHPDVDVVDGIVSVRDKNLQNEKRCYRPYYHGELLPRLLKLDSRVFFGVNYMLRRACIGKVRFLEGMTHVEDLLFYLTLASRKKLKYGHVDDVVYHYRTSAGSAMANMEGLEKGYLQLLSETKHLPGITKTGHLLLQLKIAKILFLCWRARGEWGRGWRAATKAVGV